MIENNSNFFQLMMKMGSEDVVVLLLMVVCYNIAKKLSISIYGNILWIYKLISENNG